MTVACAWASVVMIEVERIWLVLKPSSKNGLTVWGGSRTESRSPDLGSDTFWEPPQFRDLFVGDPAGGLGSISSSQLRSPEASVLEPASLPWSRSS